MTGADLAAEMAVAGSRVRLAHLERLRGLGVPYARLAELNAQQDTIGVARVRALPGGLFDYDDAGFPACLVAVVDPRRAPDDAGVFDIVAFAADDPARWWWRTGAAWALGDHWLEDFDTVDFVATPCDWLARSGKALAVLDWSTDSPAWSALRSGPALQFTDDNLRRKVRNMLVQTAPLPDMRILNDAA